MKKGGRELKLKDMNPELRGKFEQAMAKEWEGWLALNACEVIGPEAAREISRMKCLPCRFVLTDKNEMLRRRGVISRFSQKLAWWLLETVIKISLDIERMLQHCPKLEHIWCFRDRPLGRATCFKAASLRLS